jgi:hypothetical protein
MQSHKFGPSIATYTYFPFEGQLNSDNSLTKWLA